VERSSDDSSIVVTTYEGQHTHPCPATSRPNLSFVNEPNTTFTASGSHSHFVLPTLLYNNSSSNIINPTTNITTTPPSSSSYVGGASSGTYLNTSSFGGFVHDQGINHIREALLRDNGLLQDIFQMKKEDKDSVKDQH
jgi:hypothetical protein